jgi:sphingolipid delta-4 desaturase
MAQTDFVYSVEQEPHRTRTKVILKEHPEVRNLIGKNPYTFLVILGVVALQLTLAYVLKDQAWWMILLVAYCVGAFADHALFVTIHEVSHNLLFKGKAWNTLAGIVANIPSIVPTSVSFQRYHLKHHSFQGIHELDGDLPYQWEAKITGKSTIMKALWLLFYPVVQIARTFRLKEIKPIDGWVITNFLVLAVTDSLILYFWGWPAIIYLFICFVFSVGLHPLGGRWIQEHFLTIPGSNQETYSYYGSFNKINMDIGYHNEHHDFPSIPWNNLRKLKSTAPEYYDSLHSHNSWTKLVLQFLFDKNVTLHSRVVRENRGAVPITDVSTPDTDLIQINTADKKQFA